MSGKNGTKLLLLDFSIETLDYLDDLIKLTRQPSRTDLIQRALRWYKISVEKLTVGYKEIKFRGKGKKPELIKLVSIISDSLSKNLREKDGNTLMEQLRFYLTPEASLDLVNLMKESNQKSKSSTFSRALSWYDFSLRKHLDGFDKVEFKDQEGRSVIFRSDIIF